MVEKFFPKSNGMLLYETLGPRYIEFEDDSRYLYRTFNKRRKVYGYSSYFQLHTKSLEVNEMQGLLIQSAVEASCGDFLPKLSEASLCYDL